MDGKEQAHSSSIASLFQQHSKRIPFLLSPPLSSSLSSLLLTLLFSLFSFPLSSSLSCSSVARPPPSSSSGPPANERAMASNRIERPIRAAQANVRRNSPEGRRGEGEGEGRAGGSGQRSSSGRLHVCFSSSRSASSFLSLAPVKSSSLSAA